MKFFKLINLKTILILFLVNIDNTLLNFIWKAISYFFFCMTLHHYLILVMDSTNSQQSIGSSNHEGKECRGWKDGINDNLPERKSILVIKGHAFNWMLGVLRCRLFVEQHFKGTIKNQPIRWCRTGWYGFRRREMWEPH